MAVDINESTKTATERALFHALSRRSFFRAASAAAGLAVVWKGSAFAQDATPEATLTIQSVQSIPSASGLVDNYNPQPPGFFGPASQDVDSYLSIDENGIVTLRTGLVEFGQGIKTGFLQLVAEELGTKFENVTAIMGQTDETPYNLGTFGSLSTQVTGPIIRGAAAGMREWLIDLGAEQLGVAREDVTAADGVVSVTADASKSVAYGVLAAGQLSARTIDPETPLKDPETYSIVGQPIPRVDVPDKVNGSMKYGIDAALDGMIFAKIVRPPALGAKLQDVDFSAAEKLPGFVGSFLDGDFAAIVAERYEQAGAALAAVTSTWSTVDTGNTSENYHDLLKSSADAGSPLGAEAEAIASGTPVAEATPADTVTPLSLTFKDQYVNHAPIEPKNALVNATADKVEVWTSSQAPFSVQAAVAAQLGRTAEQVIVYPLASGGAFGSKIVPNAELSAAVLSDHFGKPVKLIFTREEEFQYTQYRPGMLVEVETGLAADNTISSWTYKAYTGAFYPETAENPSDSASDWGADVAEIYDIPTAKTTLFRSQSPLPPYYWRVNGAATNAFAREVTLNQLAELAGEDPVSFRLKMLGNNPRMAAVLNAVVKQAGWTPGVGSTGQGVGLALAFDGNSYVAQIVQLKIDAGTGAILIDRYDCVIDCGLIVNPEAVRHQLEGSIVLSLSPAIKEAIKFENGKVLDNTFGTYDPLRLNEAPRQIEIGFVEDKSNPMAGVGEPGVAPVIGAVASAIYDATGVWMYEAPFTKDRVLAALQAAGVAGAGTPEATPSS